MLYIWLSFEQKHGHPNYKIDDLLNENQEQSGDESTPVLDTIIPPLAGNVLVVKSNSTCIFLYNNIIMIHIMNSASTF